MSCISKKFGMFIAALTIGLVVSGCGQHAAGGETGKKVVDVSVADSRVGTLTGKKDATGELLSQHTAGVLMYGPYLQIEPGRYRVVVRGHSDMPSSAKISFDVVHDRANTTLAQKAVSGAQDNAEGILATMEFDAPHGANDLEVRAIASADATVTIDGYSIYKLN